MSKPALTWAETLSRLRADRKRLACLLADSSGEPPPLLTLHPSFLCVLFYRIAHHFHRSGHKYLARLFWQCNVLITGADVSAPADLGPGLVIVNPAGTSIMASAGRNLTLMPLSGLGSELGRRQDIGAGPGLPLLGDDVTLEALSGVLGPVRIGDRVRIRSLTVAVHDTQDDFTTEASPVRFLAQRHSL